MNGGAFDSSCIFLLWVPHTPFLRVGVLTLIHAGESTEESGLVPTLSRLGKILSFESKTNQAINTKRATKSGKFVRSGQILQQIVAIPSKTSMEVTAVATSDKTASIELEPFSDSAGSAWVGSELGITRIAIFPLLSEIFC
jgi:hypothetical protein